MDYGKKPKYSIGDVVVNTLYGTVGTITDIKMMDDTFLYEINHSSSLYLEHTLVLLSEFEGNLLVTEEIEIRLPYFFGDIVRLKGNESELYIIVGIRTEIWRYQDDGWEEMIYELKSLSDQSFHEATPEELLPLAHGEHSFTFMQDVFLRLPFHQDQIERGEQTDMHHKSEKDRLRLTRERKEIIDGLLDIYNDYKALYEWFHDNEYKRVMDLTLNNLRNFVNKKREGNG